MRYLLLLFLPILFFSQSLVAQLPEALITKPEKTQYTETSLYADVISFIQALDERSDLMHVTSMGESPEGKEIPLVVLADPAVTSPEEAIASGKPVIYVQGNIHSGEVEGKEVLQILMREILLGDKKHLLEGQILLFAPIYNTDSNDKLGVQTRRSQEGSPLETGLRSNSEGWDLNRDGIKMEAKETQALVANVINAWDPQVLVDLHTTNGTWHGYSLTWAPSYHYAGEKGPFDFTWDVLLPEVTEKVLRKYDIHLGPYGYHNLRDGWPVTAIYTYNHHPRYLVNQMGLRNRIGILSEAFAHERFYQRMNSTHAFVTEILEFTKRNASQILAINAQAEEDARNLVREYAGKVKKGVRFEMSYLEDVDDYRSYEYIPYMPEGEGDGYLSADDVGYRQPAEKAKLVRGTRIVTLDSVKNYSAFTPVVESTLPSGYVIPAHLKTVADHLEKLGAVVKIITEPLRLKGEVFIADSLSFSSRSFEGHYLARAYGRFEPAEMEFGAGDLMIELDQPLANLIFYMLEPESDDGLLTWNFFDEYFSREGIEKGPVAYPVFKYFPKAEE